MRKFIQFFILALSLSFLASCGGGGSELPGSSGSKESLKEAYFKIQKGMSPEQVIAVVGSEPSQTYRYNGQIYTLGYWTGATSSSDYAILTVGFDALSGVNKGVQSKSFGTLTEKDSQLYTD
jgi:hypothetical protein